MKTSIKIQLVLFGILLQNFAFAQSLKTCGTDEEQKRIWEEHPELRQKFLAEEEEYIKLDKQEAKTGYASRRAASVVYIIPVVFHILHQNGPENISNIKVQEALDVMNRDFRKMNADTANTIALFKPLMADCEIEFKLATIDPTGNCTNGIERFYTWQTNNGGQSAKFSIWPRNKYLNIWVVKKMGAGHASAAAYSQLPANASSASDGIMCLFDYVGTNQGNSHTLSHEAGHWLNLAHTWGSTNQPNVACGDDNVSDTPLTRGSNLVCNVNLSFCNSPIIENVQNFMDYSFCTTMFTLGQKNRMRAALNSATAGRNNLWTSGNLAATGTDIAPLLCTADFISNNFTGVICEDGIVTYSDVSYNGAVTSRSWTFPGGVLNPPSTSTDSIISVKYLTAGSYDVSLSASNASTSVSTTKQNVTRVLPSLAAYNGTSYTESFETAPLPNADWEVVSPENTAYTWQQYTSGGASGTSCAFIENIVADTADLNELISPTINVQAIGASFVHFKYAFRRQTSNDKDALKIWVSTDCGKTWSIRKTISGAGLATVTSPSTFYFAPTSPSDWRQDSASIVSVANKTNVRIKFQFICGEGNNFFLDDINLIGPNGLQTVDASGVNLALFPNPAKGTSTLSFGLSAKRVVSISVSNLIGKQVAVLASELELGAGNHRFELNKNEKFLSGIYFVKASFDGQSFVKKLVIE